MSVCDLHILIHPAMLEQGLFLTHSLWNVI